MEVNGTITSVVSETEEQKNEEEAAFSKSKLNDKAFHAMFSSKKFKVT